MGDDEGEEEPLEDGQPDLQASADPQKLSVMEQKILEERSNMMVAHFLFSLVWSVGAVLDGQSRIKFDEFFRDLCDSEGTKSKHPRYVSLP